METGSGWEDYDLWCKMAEQGAYGALDQIFAGIGFTAALCCEPIRIVIDKPTTASRDAIPPSLARNLVVGALQGRKVSTRTNLNDFLA